jgi:threonine/homoserine/homoserine lactone efflux protein
MNMSFVIAALTFGLIAGFKPGPLGIFVLHQTMSRGLFHGFMSSLAPIVTDGPIILVALFLMTKLQDLRWFTSGISILGALYLIYIAYKILKSPDSMNPSQSQGKEVSSLTTAIKINFLSPAPYLFWFTIGSGYLVNGTPWEAAIFIMCMLFSLCTSKFVIAFAIRKLGERFSAHIYAMIMKSLAFPLFLFSVQLLYSGITIWM